MKIRNFFHLFSLKYWTAALHIKHITPVIKLINKTVRKQRKDPMSIPIIIISYNRVNDLKELVSFLLNRKHKNIIIIDNKSTYPPLLEYYKDIENKVTIEYMDKNYGHLVFWHKEDLVNKYASAYYVITDSDIIPNTDLPNNYMNVLINTLDKYRKITKVGFALCIDNIPDSFSFRDKVIAWERKFWERKIEENLYEADIDTTFALYYPRYRYLYTSFYKAIRIANNFTAKHGGWYIDSKNLTDEDKFYYKNANDSNSWKLDDNGDFIGNSETYK